MVNPQGVFINRFLYASYFGQTWLTIRGGFVDILRTTRQMGVGNGILISMSDSEFRYRGIKVVVDTTNPAEFDIASFQIGDAMLDRFAVSLKSVPFSRDDRVVGDVRIRLLEEYDVMFFVGREDGTIVITISGVLLPDPDNPTEKILQKLGKAAILRGATGL